MSYLEEHRDELFPKYSDEELIKDIISFQTGKGHLHKVLNNWFKECIYNCTNDRGKMTPMKALQDDEIMARILENIESKPKFYTGKEVSNVESFFRNGGRIACKVANFDPVTARSIYSKYLPDWDMVGISGHKYNCLDTSMGFGSRFSSVALSGHNYCGFDPNRQLFEQLIDYESWLKKHHIVDDAQRIGMYCCGSEQLKPQLVDTFDVSFTSPPYFNLEKYSDDNSASTSNYNNYDKWLELFAVPTVHNTCLYLRRGGGR